MGRTAPPARVLVEAEADRLRRLARRLRDPEDRLLLEDLLEDALRVLEAYRYVPMHDPLEPLLLGMILAVARRCRRGTAEAGSRGGAPGGVGARGGSVP